MSNDVVSAEVARIASFLRPERDAVIAAMDEQAALEGFPTVGPETGAWLELFVRLTGATRVFEFGSGFGYSAYWFARGIPPDGEVILTEIDRDELEQARAYFAEGNLSDRARFELGDAIDIVDRYDGPFDVVLIDNEKERYVEAFDSVRDRLESGSLVLADNALTAGEVVDTNEVLGILDGDDGIDPTTGSEGIADYLRYVRQRDDCDSALLPLGQGLAVTRIQ